MNILKLFLALMLSVMISACGSSNEGVMVSEKKSFVYFTGNALGASATVGDSLPFVIEKLGQQNIYKVATGKQRVTVQKSGVVLVDRIVLLGDGQTKEFHVPL